MDVVVEVFFRLNRLRGFLGVEGGLGGGVETVGTDSSYSLLPVDGVGGAVPRSVTGDLVINSAADSSFALASSAA